MQFEEFSLRIKDLQPPEQANQYATAMWYDAKNDWEKAHTIIQDIDNTTAAWIHAYLHRKEGDAGNAAYWYRRAGKKMPEYSLEREWEEIVRAVV